VSADPQRRPLADLDAEQEVDFGRYGRMILARWWLPVGLLVAGLVIGYLVSVGSNSSSWRATAQVYLGQPLSPGGAAAVSSPTTQLGLVSSFVTSSATVRSVAAEVGLKGHLGGHITTKPILGVTTTKVGAPAPLLAITVTGSSPRKIAEAANRLADLVVKEVAPYQQTKIQTLKQQYDYDTAQLAAVNERLVAARATQSQVLADKAISPTDKLVAVANLNSVITQALAQQVGLAQDRFAVSQQLSLAQDVEAGRVFSPAVATKSAGPSARTGAAIGGLIGLIVGILAALLWDPIAARSRAQTEV
jgi:capsular polysaccharide biosynthesis protein